MCAHVIETPNQTVFNGHMKQNIIFAGAILRRRSATQLPNWERAVPYDGDQKNIVHNVCQFVWGESNTIKYPESRK